jgi:hypothetical protein
MLKQSFFLLLVEVLVTLPDDWGVCLTDMWRIPSHVQIYHEYRPMTQTLAASSKIRCIFNVCVCSSGLAARIYKQSFPLGSGASIYTLCSLSKNQRR